MQTGKNKRKVLTLADRMSAIEHFSQGKSATEISRILGCGRTQISTIIKNSDSITALWNSGNGRANQKTVKSRKVSYGKIDELVWEWFCTARANNLPGKLIRLIHDYLLKITIALNFLIVIYIHIHVCTIYMQ